MENVTEWIVQLGALGLLGYLIVWVTRSGAPMLFSRLDGIQSAIETNSARLLSLEKKVDHSINAINGSKKVG